jgi:DNA-binding transcriptional ArsR family regulator
MYGCNGGDFMKHSHSEFVPALKALSDETRLKIIDMLSCGEMCACDILENSAYPNQHLAII